MPVKVRKVKRPARKVLRREFPEGLLERNQPYLVLDVETGGLDPKQHSLIEVAYAVIVNRFITLRRQLLINDGKVITDRALEVNGYERKKVQTEYMDASKAALIFVNDLTEYIDPFQVDEHFIPVGHNVGFDLRFIEAWLKDAQLHEFYWMCIDEKNALDTLTLSRQARNRELILTENAKLEEVARYFGVDRSGAHTAKVDVEVTIDVLARLLRLFHRAQKVEKESLVQGGRNSE